MNRRLRQALVPVPSLRHKWVRRIGRGSLPLRAIPRTNQQRVLFVMHDAPGGVANTTDDLASAFDQRLDVVALVSDPYALTLRHFTSPSTWSDVGRVDLQSYWTPRPRRVSRYRQAYRMILSTVMPDVVHIRHLLGHTLDLADVLAEMSIPWLYSAHDYYPICPSVHLLDESQRYCGGVCTSGDGDCPLPVSWLGEIPDLKHGEVLDWHRESAPFLAAAGRIVVTSEAVAQIYRSRFPDIGDRLVEIEHGRRRSRVSLARPAQADTLRVLVLGSLDQHKGVGWLKGVLQQLERSPVSIEVHSVGASSAHTAGLSSQPLFHAHGRYERSELSALLQQISPHLAFLPSVWPETYSHTLSECWDHGLPVIVGSLGAPALRVQQQGAGWVVDVGNVQAAAELLCELAEDPAAVQQASDRATEAGRNLPTLKAMAEEYLKVYEQCGLPKVAVS